MTSSVLGANVVQPRPAQATLTVVPADVHPAVRSGLRAVVEGEPGVRVVAEAKSGREAVRENLLHRPDVLLRDLELRDPSGIAAIREVRRAAPDVAVLVFTLCEDYDSVFAAMRAGARGIINKAAILSTSTRSPT